MLTARALGAPRLPAGMARGFASTAAAASSPRQAAIKRIQQAVDYKHDDASSVEHRRMMGIEDSRQLISRSILDAPALAAEAAKHPYQPPKGTLRLTRQVDLSDPDAPFSIKRVLLAPVSSLPLKTPEAIHRLKVLAGPRWTPGKPGRGELGPDAPLQFAEEHARDPHGKDGYVKISEDSYPDGNMNRKSVSDMLERLVEAANDPKSPLPADTPIDFRPLLAKERKRRSQNVYARSRALAERKDIIGGVRGFPKEWLSAEAAAKLGKA